MTKQQIISHINMLSRMALSHTKNALMYNRIGQPDRAIYYETTRDAYLTSGGILAREIGIASMVWDKPETLAKAA